MTPITKLQKIILNDKDWQRKLGGAPYHLTMKEKGDLILFKYNQISSDFHNKAVREARGIILDRRDWSIVCRGFDKFGNYGESYTSKVNFAKARIQEKIDGSIIKCYFYDGSWRIGTNGMIDAFECELPYISIYPDSPTTFGDLFMQIIREKQYVEVIKAFANKESKLNKNKTYIFELISPYNRVVINYPESDIYHIGTRDNVTGKESVEDIGIQHPKEYTFNSIEDVIANAKNLPFDKEGYVVVDSNWARCKIKGVTYLSLHHLKGEGVPSERRLLEIVRNNEGEELLQYFPEYRSGYEKLENLYEKFIEKVEQEVDFIFSTQYDGRKSFALIAKDMTCPSFLFMVYSHKISANEFRKFTQEMRIESLLNYIKES